MPFFLKVKKKTLKYSFHKTLIKKLPLRGSFGRTKTDNLKQNAAYAERI